jgi:hypothetical protein
MPKRIKSLALALALPVASVASVGVASEASAASQCTRLDGQNYTTAYCTGTAGAPFYYARHFCYTSISNGYWQNGPHVSAGGYSSAGYCGGPIANRTIVQTYTP